MKFIISPSHTLIEFSNFSKNSIISVFTPFMSTVWAFQFSRNMKSLNIYKFICILLMTMAQKTISQTEGGRYINIQITEAIHHWPTLKTVLMIEEVLKRAELALSIEELKRRLPRKVMDQTLRLILAYLESKGSILIGKKGIVWIENNNPKFLKLIEKSKEIEA